MRVGYIHWGMPLETVTGFSFCWFMTVDSCEDFVERQNSWYEEVRSQIRFYKMK